MRIFLNWGYFGEDSWSYPLANIWKCNDFLGFSIFGIAIEWEMKMKEKMEKTPKSRGASKMNVSGMNEESNSTQMHKNFGHVKKVASALHSSDPFKHVK